MKNGRAKSIRFSTSEAALLERRKAILTEAGFDSPWVFPSSTSATGHTVDFKKAWDSLRKQLELPDLTLHDLRRSLASSMINSGVDASIVQRALSHADPRTTAKHYIRTTELAELDARQTALKPLYDGAKTLRGRARGGGVEVEKLVQQLKDKIEKELLPIASRMHDLLTADGRGEKDINLEESKRLVQEMNECLVDWRVYLNPTEFNRQAAWIEQWRARIVSLDSRERVAYENRRKQESVLQGAIGGRKSGSIDWFYQH